MNKKEREVLGFIKILRQSFIDADIVYKFGACYGLYEILKHLYPNATGYMVDDSHIIIKIGTTYYDISGIYKIDSDEEVKELTEDTHYIAGSWRDGQRLERMLKKYSDIN